MKIDGKLQRLKWKNDMSKIYKIISAMEGQTQSCSLKPRTVRMRVLQEVPLLKE